ncbi:Protein translocase subunit SecY [Phycisphaerales bacterium]|nr:Protein translocase subunit SecY [Phycisphaerales bacterium]
MISTFVNIFKVPELRNKVLFTIGMLLVFRIGHWIPIPGINQEVLADMFRTQQESGSTFAKVASFVSIFSGGQLQRATIFGLGIMPYITAGIIFQLLGTAIPQLKKLQEEGPTGRQKIQEYTRYVTVLLCVFQGAGYLTWLQSNSAGLIHPSYYGNPLWWVMAVGTLTAGCVFLMWLGEQIDKHGIGNGASMIIMAGIVAGMPQAIQFVIQSFEPRDASKIGYMGVVLLCAGFVGVVAGSVLMTVAQRRIPVQQAKHTRGRKVFGGQKSYLPLRLNHGGVMPIVFASSLMIFPTIVFGQLETWAASGSTGPTGWFYMVASFLNRNFNPSGFLYVLTYIGMVYFFSYFWITVQFNPEEMSKQLKESGSFIPGLRPGPRTAEYLETVMTRITFVGAAFLAVVAVMPTVVNTGANIDYTVTQFFGGTGLLIVVSVSMDFLQRVEANLLMRNYQGFLGGDDGTAGPRMRGPR